MWWLQWLFACKYWKQKNLKKNGMFISELILIWSKPSNSVSTWLKFLIARWSSQPFLSIFFLNVPNCTYFRHVFITIFVSWWEFSCQDLCKIFMTVFMMTSSNGNIFRVAGHLWRGALMFSLICTWINGWVNNGEAGDLRRYHPHYDVTVMLTCAKVYVITSLPFDMKVLRISYVFSVMIWWNFSEAS